MADEVFKLGLGLDSRDFIESGKQAVRTLEDIKKKAAETYGSVGSMSSALDRATASLRSIAAIAGVGLAVRELVQMADTYKLIEGRLKMVTQGHKDLADTEKRLFEMAQRTRTGYEATAELFTKVARNGKELGKTNDQLMAFTEQVQKSLAIGGASSTEASAALLQLGQALASGVLRGDEFRSVMENASGMSYYLAKGIGVTVGQLRTMAMDGKLTADVVLNAMGKMSKQIDQDFKNVPVTVGAAFTMLKNEVMRYVGETDKAHATTALLSDTLVGLAKNLGGVLTAATGLGIIMGGKWIAGGVTSLIAAANASRMAIAASVAHTTALSIEADREVVLAAAEAARAQTALREAIAVSMAATSSAEAAVAYEAVQAAQVQVTATAAAVAVAEQAAAAALVETSLAARLATGAMTALSTVVKTFGGWIGIAIQALIALAYFMYDHFQKAKRAAAEAAEAQIKHTDTIKKADEALRKLNQETNTHILNTTAQHDALERGGLKLLNQVKQEQGAVAEAQKQWDKYRETTSDNKAKVMEFTAALRAGNMVAIDFLMKQRFIAGQDADQGIREQVAKMAQDTKLAIAGQDRLAAAYYKSSGAAKDAEAYTNALSKAQDLGTSATNDQKNAVVALTMAEYARTQKAGADQTIASGRRKIADMREQIVVAGQSQAALDALITRQEIINTLADQSKFVTKAQREELTKNIQAQKNLNDQLEAAKTIRDAKQSASDEHRAALAALEGGQAVKQLSNELEIEAAIRKLGTGATLAQIDAIRKETAARQAAGEAKDTNALIAETRRSADEIRRRTDATKDGVQAVADLNVQLAIEAENRKRSANMSPLEEQALRNALVAEARAQQIMDKVQKQADDAKALLDNMAKSVQSSFADMIAKVVTDGIKGFGDFANAIKAMLIRTFAELSAMKLTESLVSRFSNDAKTPFFFEGGGLNVGTRPSSSTGNGITGRQQLGSALAGFGVGFGVGQSSYSSSRGGNANLAMGALGGAASGAAMGAMIGGPWGAAIGGVAGLVGGIIGLGSAAKEAQKRMAELQKSLSTDIANMVATINNDTLGQSMAQVHAQFEDLRKKTEDAYAGGANEAQRNVVLRQLNDLEAKRTAQLVQEFQEKKRIAREDAILAAAALTGDKDQVELIKRVVANQREYNQAVKDGADAMTLSAIKARQLAENQAYLADKMANWQKTTEDLVARLLKAANGDSPALQKDLFLLGQRRELDDAKRQGYTADQMYLLQLSQYYELQSFNQQQQIDAINKNAADTEAKLDEQISLAQSQLAAIEDQTRQQEQVANETRKAYESLANLSQSLKLNTALSTLSPIEQYQEAKRQMDAVVSKAWGGDKTAAGDVASYVNTYLQASQAVNAKGPAYVQDFLNAQRTVADLKEKYGAELSVEEQMLEQLKSQSGALQSQIATLQAAKDKAAQDAADQIAELKQLNSLRFDPGVPNWVNLLKYPADEAQRLLNDANANLRYLQDATENGTDLVVWSISALGVTLVDAIQGLGRTIHNGSGYGGEGNGGGTGGGDGSGGTLGLSGQILLAGFETLKEGIDDLTNEVRSGNAGVVRAVEGIGASSSLTPL